MRWRSLNAKILSMAIVGVAASAAPGKHCEQARFKLMYGCDRAFLQSYIDEFCWRRNCSIENKDN